MKVWILTIEYNDYNQYGGTFIGVFKETKPTVKELSAMLDYGNDVVAEKLLETGIYKAYDGDRIVLEEY